MFQQYLRIFSPDITKNHISRDRDDYFTVYGRKILLMNLTRSNNKYGMIDRMNNILLYIYIYIFVILECPLNTTYGTFVRKSNASVGLTK